MCSSGTIHLTMTFLKWRQALKMCSVLFQLVQDSKALIETCDSVHERVRSVTYLLLFELRRFAVRIMLDLFAHWPSVLRLIVACSMRKSWPWMACKLDYILLLVKYILYLYMPKQWIVFFAPSDWLLKLEIAFAKSRWHRNGRHTYR